MSTPLSEHARKKKQWRVRKARGEVMWVDPTRAREHLLFLTGHGMTPAMIAAQCGCSRQALVYIINGAYPRMEPWLEPRILAAGFRPRPGQAFTPTVGIRRRLKALNALGWPTEEIAARIGVSRSHLNNVCARDTAAYDTWERVDDIYSELSGTPGPSALVRRRASTEPPPLAWEDVDIDDPTAAPHWRPVRRTPAAQARAALATTTHCPHGHPLTKDNPGYKPDGKRHCKRCACEAAAEYRRRRATA